MLKSGDWGVHNGMGTGHRLQVGVALESIDHKWLDYSKFLKKHQKKYKEIMIQ